MCDPITLLTIGSAVTSAVGSISQGRAAQKQANFQSQVQHQQAQREREVSAAEEEDFRRRHSRLLASKRAAAGASGVEIGTGSPLIGLGDFAAEAELNALRIRSGGQARSTRLEQQAELTKMAGKSAKTKGMFRAGASLLSGIGSVKFG